MITLTLRLSSANVCFDFTPGLQVRWITWKHEDTEQGHDGDRGGGGNRDPDQALLIDLRLVRSHCVTTLTKLDQFHGNLDHRANLQYSTLSGTPFANPHKQERAVKQEVPIAQILQSEITSPGIIQHLASDPPATPPVTSQWMPLATQPPPV